MLKMCPLCQGTKKVKGLGMMHSECPLCEGLGKVDAEKVKPKFKPAAVPLQREALPEEYFQDEAKKKIAALKDANCAYKNYPTSFVPNKDTQNTPAGSQPVQNVPKPLTEAEVAQVRSKIVTERDDTIGMAKVALSPKVQAELKAIEDAKLAAEAAENGEATDYVDPESVASEVSEAVVSEPKIMQPIVKKGAVNGKKGSRQAKQAQG